MRLDLQNCFLYITFAMEADVVVTPLCFPSMDLVSVWVLPSFGTNRPVTRAAVDPPIRSSSCFACGARLAYAAGLL
ncbi:uncharacterized protein LOC113865096 [Abrus precatorius]|uniref:Uncharacterized protein LOC113865096 n=1 Tax=Abrus precatorius TaxID=3816 RepID=A0A8B8LFX4_ABRPR|nr:uncharacterized protein LOC113865096 [Abrus precatorius]